MQTIFALNNRSIADVLNDLRTRLKSASLPPRELTRHLLSLEEVLLDWQHALGEARTCQLELISRFSQLRIRVRCAGQSVPVGGEDNSEEKFLVVDVPLLQRLAPKLLYSYTQGVNQVDIVVSKVPSLSSVQVLLLHVAVGVLVGLGLMLFPWEPGLFVNKELLVPVANQFGLILSGFMGFVVFFSICSSIVGFTSLREFTGLAGKCVASFIGQNVLGAALVAFACALLLPVVSSGAAQGAGMFATVRNMLMGMVPTNPITPFLNGSVSQILVLAFFFGSIFLVLGEQTAVLKEMVKSLSALFTHVLFVLNKFVPAFVAITIIQLFFIDIGSELVSLAVAFALGCVLPTLLGVFLLLYACWRAGRPLFATLKAGVATYMVALCSMSSVAAYPLLVRCCKEQLRLPKKVCDLGLPISLALNKFGVAAELALVTCTAAAVFNVGLSWDALALLGLQACILALATPGVPGGILLVCSLCFTQYGIPLEAMALVVLLDLCLGSLLAVATVMATQSTLISLAGPEAFADVQPELAPQKKEVPTGSTD